MGKVIPGRYTAHMDGSFVVFVIGFRINKWWAVHKWLPVMNAMTPMLQELYRNKEELGFMDGTYHFQGAGLPSSNIGEASNTSSIMPAMEPTT